MQNAKVFLLHKKGDKNSMNNRRPVQYLSAFSKWQERVLDARSTHYTYYGVTLRLPRTSFNRIFATGPEEVYFWNFENKDIATSEASDFENKNNLLAKFSRKQIETNREKGELRMGEKA